MSEKPGFPKYIFGLHEPGGEWLMTDKGKEGWIVFTERVFRDPEDQGGRDYRRWSDRGFGIITRINHDYAPEGTIPLPQYYDDFARRVGHFVRNSKGCYIWIIGNEMNHGQERPKGQPITPKLYAECYKKCWDRIHDVSDRHQVAVGAVAPWNATTAYAGNESGDWVQYFLDILNAIRDLGCPVDAITLHTYTHGHDSKLVFSGRKMDSPFPKYHYNFRCYRDFMQVIPQDLRHLPVYITETDQDDPWENANRGWVQNAYKEINDWNTEPGNQQIRALVLYRWPRLDKWHIEGKPGVHEDFKAAMNNEYVWGEVQPPIRVSGYLLQGAFLEFFSQLGQDLCGLPISDPVVEDGLKTQYFERLVLQQDLSGKIVLKAAGAEVQKLRQTVVQSQSQVADMKGQLLNLEDRLYELQTAIVQMREEAARGSTEGTTPIVTVEREGSSAQIVEIVRPMWEDVVYQLPRNATQRYETRQMGALQYVVIHHSAVPATVTAQEIAKFHVKHMSWPGIGYHFYIDDQGRIFKTHELTTVCYHVGAHDPVSVGVCVGGNFAREIPNPSQMRSAAHLVAWLLQELDLKLEAVKGKKEFIDTQSPGVQWLAGKMWKNLLLDEVRTAQVEKRVAYASKSIYHYLLFWQTGDAWAEQDWRAAQAYIGRFRVTHGFSVDDARTARFVTIVGDPSGVDKKGEQILLDAGCRVERIAGATPAETAAILTEMAIQGQRFLNFSG
jgi:hypothetical protein